MFCLEQPTKTLAPNIITKAIIEKGCDIPEGTIIGENRADDEKRFHVSAGGVVLVTPDMLGQRLHYVR